jgi:hypothetical protein
MILPFLEAPHGECRELIERERYRRVPGCAGVN